MNEDLDEFEIDNGEMSLALVEGERREPFKDGGAVIEIGIMVEWKRCRMVEGDMGGEGVHELVLRHDRVGEGTNRRSLDAIKSSGGLFFSFSFLFFSFVPFKFQVWRLT